ncbi:hypothetical protein [Nocardia asiatica]|uniref:hypothetical protein n=1 Tax=Nocardia asiatica TaxID=209252 RepID=UPI003EE2F0FC
MELDLVQWAAVAGGPIALAGAIIATGSALYARSQARSAKKSAEAALRMAETDAQRRHDELTPTWIQPRWEATTGESWQLILVLSQGRLDHLVIEIYDSPGIMFDVSRQADVIADRLERHQAMRPGDSAAFWVRISRGHRRKLCLRVTASLEGKPWQPVLLPELDVVVPGASGEA